MTAAVLGYPLILLQHYQPIVIPGLLGCIVLFRNRRRWTAGEALLVARALLPILLYSLSAARSPRYLYPILPPLALRASLWLQRALPAVERRLAARVVPAVALAAAATFVVSPTALTRDPSRLLLCDRDLLADLAAAGRSGRTVVAGARWVLLDLSPPSEEQST